MMDIKAVFKLLVTRNRLKKHEHWSRNQLKDYQIHSLQNLRESTYKNSSFYRHFHKGLFNAPLHELPILTKATVMENFDKIVTDHQIRLRDLKIFLEHRKRNELYLGKYYVNATSGSSGRPGLFLSSKSEWASIMSSGLRNFEWAGVKPNLFHQIKMAQITTTNPSLMTAQGGKSMNNWWLPILLLEASDSIDIIINRLNEWQPEVLIAYASMLRILADEQFSGKLKIRPKSVMSGSEVLTQETRHRIEQVWGKILFNQYGYSEGGALAAECNKHQGMHLMEDLVIVEPVDINYKPILAEEYSAKLLVTILGNRTQPLIRYELEDSIKLSSSKCLCGRPFTLIEDVQGRVWETLSFPTIKGDKVNIHPIAFYTILDSLPVSGWQLIQEQDGLHLLLCGIHKRLNFEIIKDSIRHELIKQGVTNTEVQIQEVKLIPQAASGKTPLIKSNLLKTKP
jgi:phenylacetate-CoA ligase